MCCILCSALIALDVVQHEEDCLRDQLSLFLLWAGAIPHRFCWLVGFLAWYGFVLCCVVLYFFFFIFFGGGGEGGVHFPSPLLFGFNVFIRDRLRITYVMLRTSYYIFFGILPRLSEWASSCPWEKVTGAGEGGGGNLHDAWCMMHEGGRNERERERECGAGDTHFCIIIIVSAWRRWKLHTREMSGGTTA